MSEWCCGLEKDSFWVQCDQCEEWFHGVCAKVTQAQSEQYAKWFCQKCGLDPIMKVQCRIEGCSLMANYGKYCTKEHGMLNARRLLRMLKTEPYVPKSGQYNVVSLQSDIDKVQQQKQQLQQEIQQLQDDQCGYCGCSELRNKCPLHSLSQMPTKSSLVVENAPTWAHLKTQSLDLQIENLEAQMHDARDEERRLDRDALLYKDSVATAGFKLSDGRTAKVKVQAQYDVDGEQPEMPSLVDVGIVIK